MTDAQGLTIVFVGGGTGGHIFPALAIAERIREIRPDAGCVFLVSDRPLDASILRARGEDFTPLHAKPFLKSPAGLIRFARSWGPSVRATRGVLEAAKSEGETRLVAMGGFVCAPAVRAAMTERVPITLVNLDAVPGLANAYAAKRAGAVVSATPVHGWEVVGPIVRAGFTDPPPAPECRRSFGLDPERPVVFISGGSQGARSINLFVRAMVESRPDAFASRGWQVIHQTGRDADASIGGVYERAGVRAHVAEFIDDMPSAWGAADLSIARAGAGTVAEAWATRTPCVFLPFPHHADDHQRRNAQALVDAGGAIVVTDRVDPAQNLAEHADDLAALLTDPARAHAMRDALGALGPADGARRVAQMLA